MSTEKRILKNGLAAIIQKAIKICEQLLLIPFFIKYWGAGYYGEWLTLTVVPSFLALSDFGFGSSAANTFLLKYASGDERGAADTAKTGVFVLNFLAFGALLLSIIILLILNVLGSFDKLLIAPSEAIWATFFLLVTRVINFYQQIFEAHYRAARRASLSINFQSGLSALNILAGFLIIINGGKALDYALGLFILTLIMNPIYIIVGERILGLNKRYKGKVDKAEIKEIVQKGFGYFLAPIWQAVYYQGSTFVVRIVLGATAVTIFNTVRTVIRSAGQTFSILIMAAYPDFQFELASGNLQKAKNIFLGILGTNILISVLFSVFLYLFGNQLYILWTHNALNVPSGMWVLFISGIVFYACWYTFSFVFEALNKPYVYTVASLICALMAILLSWALCKYVGIEGAAIGNLSFDIVMCIYLVPKGATTLKMNIKDIFKEALTSTKRNAMILVKHFRL